MLLAFVAAATVEAAGQTEAATTPVIENERVKVWDITLAPGKSTRLDHHENDFVTMFLVGGEIRSTDADGKTSVSTRQFGDAIFSPKSGRKGGVEEEEVISGSVVSGSVARMVVVELKDHLEAPYVNKSGYPAAFPRAGSKRVLDNDRVVVWTYSWTPGVPTPMHFHDKDVVVVYRYDGSLKSSTPDGKSVVNDYKAGSIRFNKGDRTHFEELVSGQQSAMILELK
jgi:predicted metal-dependent enzyme (double-stranded beta helix superfamily)